MKLKLVMVFHEIPPVIRPSVFILFVTSAKSKLLIYMTIEYIKNLMQFMIWFKSTFQSKSSDF